MNWFSLTRGPFWHPLSIFLVFGLLLALGFPCFAPAQEPVERTWGFGYDHGLTVRAWLGGLWEVSLAAGPSDYLSKVESRSWLISSPSVQQGLLEVPEDVREEHGWVRMQVGRLIRQEGQFTVVGYGGVVYEWLNSQERSLVLHDLNNDYDTFELDRHTRRWIMSLGFRPAWQPVSFMTVEAAFGLNFIVENWDQTIHRTWSGAEGDDYQEFDGHVQIFEDFGLEAMASIQVFIWL